MAVPSSPGGRTTDRPPNMIQVITDLRRRVNRLENRTPPETVHFVPADTTRWEPIASVGFVDIVESHVVRRGKTLYVDMLVYTPFGTGVEARIVSGFDGIEGPVVTIPAGDDLEHPLTLTYDMPEEWPLGVGYRMSVAARRSAGTTTPRLAVIRSHQR